MEHPYPAGGGVIRWAPGRWRRRSKATVLFLPGEVEAQDAGDGGSSTSTPSGPICRRSSSGTPGPDDHPACRGGEAAPHRPAHGAREPRRPDRPRQLRRVRRASRSPPSGGGASLDDLIARTPGRRLHRRHRDRQRRAVRRRARRLRGPLLRLHGAGRDAGGARPPQEGPAVRARRAMRLPAVLFAEGGGGRPGRHRLAGRVGARRPRLRAVRRSSRGWCRGSRSSRAAASPATRCCRLLRPDRRHRGLQLGMGGPAMIEGGGLGRVRPDDVGPMSTCRRPTGWSTSWSRDEAEAVGGREAAARLLPGADAAWTAPDQARCATRPREPARAPTTSRRSSRRSPTSARCRAPGALRAGDGHGAGPDRGPAARLHRQQPAPPRPARSTRDAADKAARFLQLCDAFGLPVVSLLRHARASWSGRRPRRRGLVRHASRHARRRRRAARAADRRRAAQGLRARARRRWPAAACTSRC